MRSKMVTRLVVAMLAIPALVSAATWEIDPSHSEVQFKVRHLGISKVVGNFKEFSGTIDADPANFATVGANVTINAASITTDNEKRDAHLQSPDFFDVAKFPNLVFVAKKVSEVKGTTFNLEGDLTMHGVTKPVVLQVEFNGAAKDPWGNERASFSANGKVNRKDFGLLWNKTLENGGLLVGEDVDIVIEIEAAKKV